MKTTILFIRLLILTVLVPASFTAVIRAQEVSIPDPGLNAAIREALQKLSGSLTEQDLLRLTSLDGRDRNISSVAGLEAARNLVSLDLFQNRLTNFALRSELRKLTLLDLGFNSLAQCSLPDGLTNLDTLLIEGNLLTNFNLPAGLTNLSALILDGNQLTTLTLPPDLTKLGRLSLSGNPLTTLVLSEPLAATRLASLVAFPPQGVSVFTYPLAIDLLKPNRTLENAFEFFVAGPPGIYTVLGSTDLVAWSPLGTATNELGSILFTDVQANLSPQKFYRARTAP